MLALRVIQGSTARRSETRAPEKHVGADPRSGVYPTEPGDPAWQAAENTTQLSHKFPRDAKLFVDFVVVCFLVL